MKTVVVGTAGHIDHGKSALVQALTGTDPDRLKEEQARGITIDLGFAHAAIGDVQLAFVDVPGHERFVRNMLAGAGGIDAVLLVVAATESVMPQTREHFEICRLLGLDRGLIALTKADLADAEMVALSTSDVRDLVAGSFLEGAPIVPVSARTGRGLDDLRRELAALAGHRPRQHRAGVVRLPVDRVFTIKGFGAVVTGTLVSGAIAVGETLTILPQGDVVRVRGLQVHGQVATVVAAAQRVAVNVAGVDAAHLHRGMTLATPGAVAVTSRADVHLRLLDGARPLPHGRRIRVHHGTTEVLARISVAATRAGSAGAWAAARSGDVRIEVPPGGEALARLRFETPIVLTRGDRLVVRAASPVTTIGGARVLDPEPGAGGVRRTAALARFRQLDADDADGVVDLFLAESAGQGLDAAALVRRAGLDHDQARAALAGRVAAAQATVVGTRVFAASVVQDVRARIEPEIAAYHRAHPDEPGIPRETLRGRVADGAAPELFEAVLDELGAGGRTRGTERVALASHRPGVSAGDARLRESIEGRLRAASLAPPDPATLAAELGVPDTEILRAIRALAQDGRLVLVGTLVFHREALARLRAEVAALRHGQPAGARVTLDVAVFKTSHALTRKYAIPLLEWLDRERVTRRIGDVRIVL